jgi:hypothetical protein
LYSGVFVESAVVKVAVCKNSKCVKLVLIDKCVSLEYLMGNVFEECLQETVILNVVMKLPEAATGQQHSRRIMAAMTCWSTVWVCYFCYVGFVNKFLELCESNV